MLEVLLGEFVEVCRRSFPESSEGVHGHFDAIANSIIIKGLRDPRIYDRPWAMKDSEDGNWS